MTTAASTAVRDDHLPAISGHQPALDGIRAVAAFGVLVFHVAASTGHLNRDGAISWLLSRGEIGVPIFFTLSGLLLYRPWAASALGARDAPPRTGTYFLRRALRLLPAYWALVAASMLLYARDHLGDAWTWVKLLTLTYSYDPHPWWDNYLGPKGMGQIWSLTVEAAFYVTLPLTAVILSVYARRADDVDARARRLLQGLATYAALSLAYTIVMFAAGDQALWGMWLPRYFAWFALGMALAVLSVWARVEPGTDGPVRRLCRTVAASWGMCWVTAALLYCVAATPLTGGSRLIVDSVWTGELHILLYGLVAAFLIAPVALAPAAHPAIHRALGNRVMSYLGRISYSVFLWQFVVIYVWFDVTDHPPFTGNLLTDIPICALLTVAVAAIGYHAIEKPAHRLAHRPPRPPPTASQP